MIKIEQKINILNKVFLSIKDISILLDCGPTKAKRYREKYITAKKIEKDYFDIVIPTVDFLKFYKIDVNLLRDNYKMLKGEINAAN